MHVDRQRQRRIPLQRDQRFSVRHVHFAKTHALPNQLPFLELRIARLDHAPDAPADQRRVQRLIRIHARPHIGVH
jgi:hypothetical protein